MIFKDELFLKRDACSVIVRLLDYFYQFISFFSYPLAFSSTSRGQDWLFCTFTSLHPFKYSVFFNWGQSETANSILDCVIQDLSHLWGTAKLKCIPQYQPHVQVLWICNSSVIFSYESGCLGSWLLPIHRAQRTHYVGFILELSFTWCILCWLSE